MRFLMRVLIGISHPKQVHMFKNLIKQLAKNGSEINIILVKREMSKYLINQLQTPYSTIGEYQPNLIKKIIQLPNWEYLTLKIVKKFRPDILLGRRYRKRNRNLARRPLDLQNRKLALRGRCGGVRTLDRSVRALYIRCLGGHGGRLYAGQR